jgi:hypothetical protein
MKFNAELIDGFSSMLLSKGFDDFKETPDCHRLWWDAFCSDNPLVAICAPRGHGKSTALTHCFTLASALFKQRSYIIIVSDTYEQAVLFLQDIKKELINNEDLIALFGVEKIEKDAENDIIVRLQDNYKFRITAKGAEQKMRGLKWSGKRPDMILCHQEGTEIYTPETGWIKNQDHPAAKKVEVDEVYKVTFEDGSTEIVSADHRYLVGEAWTYPWQLKKNDNVNENISEDTLQRILKNEKSPAGNIVPNQRQKPKLKSGENEMLSSTKLAKLSGILRIKLQYLRKLRNMQKSIPHGKPLLALNEELENLMLHLRGLISRISNTYMRLQTSYPEVQVLTT